MTYDKQDLLLDLRKLPTADGSTGVRAAAALGRLLAYIDDEHITNATLAAIAPNAAETT